MRPKVFLGILFLLQFFILTAQDKPDTISTYYAGSGTHYLKEQAVYKRNVKGQLVSSEFLEGDEYSAELTPRELTVYTYNSMDSLQMVRISIYVKNEGWKPGGIIMYQYDGNRILLVKEVSKDYYSKDIKPFPDWKTVETLAESSVPGQKNSDLSELLIYATTYQYDANKRLIKKAIVGQYVSDIWLYLYDGKARSDLLNENAEIQYHTTIYTKVFSGEQLQLSQQEEYSEIDNRIMGVLFIHKDEYSYTGDGKLEKIIKKRETLHRNRNVSKWIHKGKDDEEKVVGREFFLYNDGRVVSEKIEYLSSYTVSKVTLLDKMAANQSTSYTRSYGDVQQGVTEIKHNEVKPTTKTKQKWESYEVKYQYDEAGNLIKDKKNADETRDPNYK